MKTRQPAGRPAIYLGSDGWYHCHVPTGEQYPNGRPKRKHVRRADAAEVLTEVIRIEGQVREGAKVVVKIDTVGAWLDHWLENIVKPNRAQNTYDAYEPIVRLHLKPLLGARRLDGRNRLETEHVEAAYAILRGRKMADGYIRQCHAVLHRALREAVRRRKASHNPAHRDFMDAPTTEQKEIQAHTLDEAQAIVRAALDDPWAVRWVIGLFLGLRQGEVLGLRWDRVRLDDKVPHLQLRTQLQRVKWQHGCDDPHACALTTGKKTKQGRPTSLHHFEPCRPARWGKRKGQCPTHTGKRGCPAPCPRDCTGHAQRCQQRHGGGMLDVKLKSKKSRREVALDAQTVEMMRAHREAQIRERADWRLPWDPKGLVFTGPKGQPVDPRRDYERWQQLLVKAGLPPARLHTGRHDAGTLMVATGTDIRAVQEILGHTDIRVTQRYVDVAAGLKQEAVNKIAAALFDGSLAALVQQSGATVRQDR